MNALTKSYNELDRADDKLADFEKRQKHAIAEALKAATDLLPELDQAARTDLEAMITEAIGEATYETEKDLIDQVEGARLSAHTHEQRSLTSCYHQSVL